MEINYLVVLVAAVASMVVGSVWYGPLFGKKYMSAMGMDNMSEEQKVAMKKGMTMTYVWQFIASFVMFFVLAWLMGSMEQVSVHGGVALAVWVWGGFVVPLKLSDAIWGGKMVLFWISISNMLVTLLVGGAIIGAW